MMRALLISLLLAPIVFCLPWIPSVWHRRWPQAAIWMALWAPALWVAIELWAGPGLIALVALGTIATFVTKIRI